MMSEQGAQAVRFRGVDWFSWVTGGGSSVVIFTTEIGVAEVLVTETRAFVLTTPIERDRLRLEEVSDEFEVVASPWMDPSAMDRWVRDQLGDGRVLSDRPRADEGRLPISFERSRWALEPEERDRYRQLAEESAQAMTAALVGAKPDWSETRLAGEGARELWSRGIHPTLVMVAGEDRLERHRHPFPSQSRLERRAMMVFCARRHGLYANLTRFVAFARPTQKEKDRMAIVAEIEADAFEVTRPGSRMSELYSAIARSYESRDLSSEIENQHFGGPTGYLSRECFARPQVKDEEDPLLPNFSAVAWNPTLPGSKIEDTILVGPGGSIEILTVDKKWPVTQIRGRPRPDVLELL